MKKATETEKRISEALAKKLIVKRERERERE